MPLAPAPSGCGLAWWDGWKQRADVSSRGILHVPSYQPLGLRWRGHHRKLAQQLVRNCEEEMTFWSQAFGSLGFKNMKGLLQEAHTHMSYTMWKRCHKIIDEARSLAKGDMYLGG